MNSLPFGQLKSFLKILIGVQYEWEMGAVFREIGLFYYIRKCARPFGKADSFPPRVPLSAQPSRASGSGPDRIYRACGRPPQRSAAQLLGGYA